MRLHKKEKLLIIIALVVGLVGVMMGNQKRGVSGDFRVAIINDDGVFLRSISPSRRMMNLMDVATDTEVWIPEGLGWYRAGTIKKILTKENKKHLYDKVFFYNFGFVPHVVLEGGLDNWLMKPEIALKWGVINYVKFRLSEESMMTKKESVGRDLGVLTDSFNEMLPRDFADSDVLSEDLKISVYNQSDQGGLAGFVARNLEWSGLTIVGVDNYSGSIAKCQVVYGKDGAKFEGFKVVKKIFESCSFSEDDNMASNEAEITLGNEYASMLNYQSYRKQ